MAREKNKVEVITFKASSSLLQAMKGVPNRSEFIRAAILAALDSVCPVCKGTGILTPNQRKHWKAFSANHFFEECQSCHELRLVCKQSNPDRHVHAAEAT